MFIRSIVLLILIMLLTVGCGQANRDHSNNIERTSFGGERNGADQETADRLVSLALKDPNVIDATAVVVGNYAIVGIDLPANMNSTSVGSIKYAVAQALKKDPKGANAIVTSDADTMQRLREMGAAIRAGKPIRGIADELSDMVNRLMPQFPQKVEHKVEPESKPKNMRRIPTH